MRGEGGRERGIRGQAKSKYKSDESKHPKEREGKKASEKTRKEKKGEIETRIKV